MTLVHLQALVPRLKDERGHFLNYHLAVNRAVRKLGWSYQLAAPQLCTCPELPEGWHKCLVTEHVPFSPKWAWRLCSRLRYSHSIYAFLKQTSSQHGRNIIFVEYMKDNELSRLLAALAMRPASNVQLWFHHRRLASELASLGCEQRFLQCFKKLSRLLGRDNIVFMADNQTVADSYQQLWGFPVHLVPIPLAHQPLESLQQDPNGPLRIWGRTSIQNTYGVQAITHLVSRATTAHRNLHLYLEESVAPLLPPNAATIKTVPATLSNEDYRRCLAMTDVLLLLYDPVQYKNATSGIFVEAISHGKIVFTTKGTWAADELRRFGLEQLITDWRDPNLLSTMRQVTQTSDIREKLAAMQAVYLDYHSPDSFARHLARLAARA